MKTIQSVMYEAPEVFNRKRELKSDVWSLGITLIEMAKREDPYMNYATFKADGRVCSNGSPAYSGEKWSAEYVDFVGRCLVEDVKERWGVQQLMEVSHCWLV